MTESAKRSGGAGSIARGATIIAIGALASKIIGAAYRIPLTNIIGAESIGLYQMVFPVYCALLTFSSSGLPAAISKLIANGEEKGYLRNSLLLFGGLGLLGSALM
ncbi:MAG: oligosaccharide flippase family protein, partial [Clostridia bacterium]|nr:oligosaccharide flippase family protein [Clostridia bacterium]